MLFAKPDRFYLVLRNAECRYKCFTDRIGPALALIEVVFSAAFRVSVTDDQKAVSQLNWIVQGIRHGAEDPVGYRANDRGVEIERYFNGELRKLVQLFGEWGTIDPLLVRGSEEIASTDVPNRVLAAFRNNQITDVHLIARRGPAQAKFTPVELRGLGDLLNAEIVVRLEEMLLSDSDEISMGENRELRTNIARLREWADTPSQEKTRRLHIRFLRSPARILGEKRVEGILLEGNEQLADGRLRGIGNFETLKVDMIFRAVGYRSLRLPDVPFDEAKSIIPNHQGRVLDEDGELTDKEYVTGWAKRGPSGTIGTNRSDSAETVCTLLADIVGRKVLNGSDPEQILTFLDNRRVDYTNWMNWLRLDDYETQLGRKQGRPRVKIPDLRSMLELSRDSGTSGFVGDD